jgi:hypothetical protein
VNTVRARGLIQFAAALLLGIGAAAAPGLTYAQHASGGGMGGAHMGGAPHMGGVGGSHFGGSHPGFGGGARAGFAAPHYSPGRVMGGYYGHGAYPGAAHGTYAGAAHYGYAGGGRVGYPGARVGYAGARVGYAGHPGSAYYYGGHYWGGGYWHGAYWPYCYYHPGFVWYYPVLPIGYATFWWGGVPYYYWNNLYYTYNPGYNGYVVTDPPPVGGSDEYGSGDPSSVTAEPQGAPAAGAGADIYVYPRNGQTDAQTSSDRYECHSWAVGQTGFDPTRATQNGGTPADYKRAMIACLDARGYSAR